MNTACPAKSAVRRIGVIEGLDQDNFVAGLQEGLGSDEEAFGGAGGHGNLGERVQVPLELSG